MLKYEGWQTSLESKDFTGIWNAIASLSNEKIIDRQLVSNTDSDIYLQLFSLLQHKQIQESQSLLSSIIPQPETAYVFGLASALGALFGIPIDSKKMNTALLYDKGELFSSVIAAIPTYAGLVETLFSTDTIRPYLLESAYKYLNYPWLYEELIQSETTQKAIASFSESHLKGLLYFFNNQFEKSLLSLIPLLKTGSTHWTIHWLIAKAAYATKRFDLVERQCQHLLSIKPNFWYARELSLHVSGYFAQIAQDKVAEKFFKSFKPQYKTSIEVGAFDGVHYSNVRHFTLFEDWSSIHIEPVSDNFNRLKRAYSNHPKAKLFNNAVSPDAGTIDIHVSSYSNLSEWGSDVASVLEGEKKRWDSFKPDWHVEKAPTITLDDAIKQAGFEGVDLISIDAEGYDLEVLQTINLEQYRPQLIIIEYGTKRKEILSYANSFGYTLYDDNGQDLFLTPGEYREINEIKHLFNPHFLKVHEVTGSVFLQKVLPIHLLSRYRFDLSIKYAYAKHYLSNTLNPFIVDAYKAHIKAFNDFNEGDGSGKVGFEAFKTAFENVIDSIKEHGFSAETTVLPLSKEGVLMDGAHRLAAALALNVPVLVARTSLAGPMGNFEYFKARGLSEEFLDFGALTFVNMDSSAKTLTLFPSAEGKQKEVLELIHSTVPVVYQKTLELSSQAGFNLVRQMYQDEAWLGNFQNGFAGARFKASECFKGSDSVRLFIIQSHNLDALRELKEKIRALYQVENHSVHINDTHPETELIAGALLNKNSLHFLDNAQIRPFANFYGLIHQFEQWLKSVGISKNLVCVDGSATLSVYGLRECGDLDFLHEGEQPWGTGLININSHNIASQLQYHAWGKDEILYNPELHFYYNGIKFITPNAIKAMKQKRGEGKDVQDVNLIEELMNQTIRLVTLSDYAHLSDVEAGKKIIGLIPVKNEATFIQLCIRALAKITDAIIVLDDHSEDNTLALINEIKEECKVVEIIEKTNWHRDEPGDRNLLLEAGRNHGGTHFVVIDADEVFTSNLTENNILRRAILSLKPGDKLLFNWIQLWRDISYYRFDQSVWTWNIKPFIFCDDGISRYESEFIHTNRFPTPLKGMFYVFKTYEHGLLHFQFVNWHNLLVKQAWYRVLERIRDPKKSSQDINSRYFPSKDERGLQRSVSPLLWFKEYLPWLNLDSIMQKESWRTEQIRTWFNEYGTAHFSDLDIWDIDWGIDTPIDAFGLNIHEQWNARIEKVKSALAKQEFQNATSLLEAFLGTEYHNQASQTIQKIETISNQQS